MKSIDIAGTRVAYRDHGTGEPVVLLHCSSANSGEWKHLSTRLSAGFRTIAPDQWHCGGSEAWTGRQAFSLAEEALPVLELIAACGQPVHLVGHSYGGGLALHIACTHPELICSLTLIEPSIFHVLRHAGTQGQTLYAEIADVAQAVTDAVTSGNYWAGMERFVDYWTGTGTWRGMAHELRIRMSQRITKVVLDFRALFDEPATIADYAALRMPTLLVRGDRSPAPSRHIVAMLASVMPGASVTVIAGAGHMSPVTHADAVNAAIETHLRRVAGAGAARRRAA